jgi:ABC-2 type transport system permease protein
LSGALYPVRDLPAALAWVAAANPFSYGVDLLKHAMIAGIPAPFGPDFDVAMNIAVLLAFTAAATAVAAYRFSRGAVLEAVAGLAAGPRRE